MPFSVLHWYDEFGVQELKSRGNVVISVRRFNKILMFHFMIQFKTHKNAKSIFIQRVTCCLPEIGHVFLRGRFLPVPRQSLNIKESHKNLRRSRKNIKYGRLELM